MAPKMIPRMEVTLPALSIPKPEYAGSYPLLVVELKWNQSADTAIKQIKEKRYAKGFELYTGDILLVGIDYDKKSKEHHCVIEKVEKEWKYN